MREKQIEQKLVRAVRAAGGIAPKFVSPGLDGVPDRIILLPGERMAFAELKAPGQMPRPLQQHRIEQLRQLGFRVYIIDNINQIGGVLDEVSAT
ncbi:MAG: VRR-NUC domain-containing protein [Clostridia bacterium]|nr:VRR-NUC domain-containing protein [Clostridia bacterium]